MPARREKQADHTLLLDEAHHMLPAM